MGRDRAAYMRDYRARKLDETTRHIRTAVGRGDGVWLEGAELQAMNAQTRRVTELEAEVRQLKRELATRPLAHAFNSKPFTPVPKPG